MGTATLALPNRPTSRPYLALGLTFLLLGVGFASPVRLVPAPPAHIWQGAVSVEALNLYALVVFTGWSHFAYAWRGQWKSTARLVPARRWMYWLLVAVSFAALTKLRFALGAGVFSLLAWVYNIAHFVKSEVFFAGERRTRVAFYSPVAAFAWFTVVLFQAGPLANRDMVFAGTVAIAAVVLAAGGWKLLSAGEVRLPLLTLFLLGETLVWSGYSPYMSDAFRVGVYIVHIAAASFYHYLTGYFFAASATAALHGRGVLLTNAAIFALCFTVAWWPRLWFLRPVFGAEWFTLWVALHLAASDLLPRWKHQAPQAARSACNAD